MMNEIVSIIQNASPVLAAVILGMMFKIRTYGKEIEQLQKRIDAYDKLHIEAMIAEINTSLEFIKSQLATLTQAHR